MPKITRTNPDIVTASEFADYVSCPEAWRLREIGITSANRTQLDSGVFHHARTATAERVAGSSITIGWRLVFGALFAPGCLWPNF
jgi:hypothetical protein